MSTPTKVALITGANKGIGLETARQLGKLGIAVIIGARDAARGNAAASQLKGEGITAHFVQLDVTDQASVTAAAAKIGKDFGRLDILVNNAGVLDYGGEATPSTVAQDILRSTFDLNFFGLIAVTQAMLPLIRQSPAGRIVNLTSILGSIAEHADPNSPILADQAGSS